MSGLKVEEAIKLVLQHTKPLNVEMVPLSIKSLLGRILSEDVRSNENIPAAPVSIMDGYAVCAPLKAGVYRIQEKVHAGDVPQGPPLSTTTASSSSRLNEASNTACVSYITTGAMLPAGANAVVKVEDTELLVHTGDGDGLLASEKEQEQQQQQQQQQLYVRIKVDVAEHKWVRSIGSDIALGERILKERDTVGAVELGLLATLGICSVRCYRKPVVGVMSTGNELVDPWQTELGPGQVRDSNRIALLAALHADGYDALDLGITGDDKNKLREKLVSASANCDVVISSGGVSMGAADFIKPLLAELGTIHFQRLNMKPGKPTTFATMTNKTSGKQTLFFGLPGNPCSCLVTKNLFVDPALRRLQGLDSLQCLHSQLDVVLDQDLPLDDERAEYHRATVSCGGGDDDRSSGISSGGISGEASSSSSGGGGGGGSSMKLVASSTGMQRSSRLLSMRSANALLCLPRGTEADRWRRKGETVKALVLGPVAPPAILKYSAHPSAAGVDLEQGLGLVGSSTSSNQSTASPVVVVKEGNGPVALATVASAQTSAWRAGTAELFVRVGILTVSDRASKGVYEDKSGPEIAKILEEMSDDITWPMTTMVTMRALVPDEITDVQSVIRDWTDDASSANHVDLLLTTGGTGFGLRDTTPEAVGPLLHRHAPGVAQALLNEGLKHTQLAVLSRPVVGTRNKSLICTLPGR